MIVLHIRPVDLASILAAGTPSACRYLARALALPTPSPSVGQARAQGDPSGLAAALAALLSPHTVLRIGRTAVTVGTSTTATVARCPGQDVFHVVADDTDPATVVVRALGAELAGCDRMRLLLGRWTPNGQTEHQILVDTNDLETVAADLLGLDGCPATTR